MKHTMDFTNCESNNICSTSKQIAGKKWGWANFPHGGFSLATCPHTENNIMGILTNEMGCCKHQSKNG